MVGGKDANSVRIVERDKMEVLIDGVGSTLEPMLAAPHLRRDERNEKVASAKGAAELPSSFDVFVQGLAFELHQYINSKNAAVYQIGKRKINDTVLCCKMDCGFCPVFRQRHKPLPFPSSKHHSHCTAVFSCLHAVSPLLLKMALTNVVLRFPVCSSRSGQK